MMSHEDKNAIKTILSNVVKKKNQKFTLQFLHENKPFLIFAIN